MLGRCAILRPTRLRCCSSQPSNVSTLAENEPPLSTPAVCRKGCFARKRRAMIAAMWSPFCEGTNFPSPTIARILPIFSHQPLTIRWHTFGTCRDRCAKRSYQWNRPLRPAIPAGGLLKYALKGELTLRGTSRRCFSRGLSKRSNGASMPSLLSKNVAFTMFRMSPVMGKRRGMPFGHCPATSSSGTLRHP